MVGEAAVYHTQAETIHSTSKYIQPLENPTAYAKAKYMPFAPASCVCHQCFTSEGGQKRTYAIMYDSKLEINRPLEPCMCCSTEQCIVDRVQSMYLDKPPFRSGMCCVCVPCTCCGPPVIFSKTPKCCCVDTTDCFGQQVWAAPADIFGLKTCGCCCKPCYQYCAYPLITGVSDATTFMGNMKAASDAYYLKHPEIEVSQRATFEEITDNISLAATSKKVGENEEMSRG